MAMSTGGGGSGLTNEPNVTPMIDVLLVLLIIFMMVIPIDPQGDRHAVARSERRSRVAASNPDQIVLEVLPDGKYAINKEPIDKAQLFTRLKDDLRSASREDHFREGRHDREVRRRDLARWTRRVAQA